MNAKVKISVPLIVVNLLLLLLTACQHAPRPACENQGIQYCKTDGIFGGKWFDYYERGLSCMEGECYDAALADLTRALRRRDRDERMAKTYGFHFMDYFPHREKGIIHYLQGDYEQAKKELELSLHYARSDKALIWLDEVRIRLMEQAGQPLSLPVLRVDFPEGIPGNTVEKGKIRTRNALFPIQIHAEDPQYIASLTLEDHYAGQTETRNLFLESSAQKTAVREELAPEQGEHEIRIIAENLQGGQSVREFRLYADRIGPVIALETFRPGEYIKGSLYDESGDISLNINGKPVPLRKAEDHWIFEMRLSSDSPYPQLTATDRLGNQTIAKMADFLSAGILHQTPNPLLAEYGNAVSDMNPVSYSPKPLIHLEKYADRETVYTDRIFLRGHVKSSSPLKEVGINKTSLLNAPGQQTGTIVFFTHSLKLEEGENKIVITAKDEAHSEALKEIFIERKIPDAFHWKNRYRLALYPFEGVETSESAKQFQYFLMQGLAERKRFSLLMRDEIQKMLKDFPALADRSSPGPPHALLFGFVHQSKNGTEIIAEFTDKTSESIEFADVYARRGKNDAPEILARKLLEKIHRKFPLSDGTVREITADTIRIKTEKWMPCKGKNRIKWPVLVYRPENTSADGNTAIIGSSRISSIITGGYESPFIPGTRIGDRIISQ
ncbi:MAG: hypothetical protein V2I97_14955 [Desulfococcaceae bacterium]|jgi:tetratricopeptide (TPR) repeat protein|nr:hypothetical protein [Desulfococcaceae bacterium]